MVAINYADEPQAFRFSLSGSQKPGRWHLYRTSDKEGEDLAAVGLLSQPSTLLPPRSVTTFVSEGKP
jgi:hypothetical protein